MLDIFVRTISAASKFSLKPDFEFISFDDVSAEDMEDKDSVPGELDLWAAVKVFYDGQVPESYKALNLLIGDWVEKNVDALTRVLHEQLKQHFGSNYPESEISDLDQVEDSAVWLDQLDYMPILKPGDNSMTIEIELVLHAEPIGE